MERRFGALFQTIGDVGAGCFLSFSLRSGGLWLELVVVTPDAQTGLPVAAACPAPALVVVRSISVIIQHRASVRTPSCTRLRQRIVPFTLAGAAQPEPAPGWGGGAQRCCL